MLRLLLETKTDLRTRATDMQVGDGRMCLAKCHAVKRQVCRGQGRQRWERLRHRVCPVLERELHLGLAGRRGTASGTAAIGNATAATARQMAARPGTTAGGTTAAPTTRGSASGTTGGDDRCRPACPAWGSARGGLVASMWWGSGAGVTGLPVNGLALNPWGTRCLDLIMSALLLCDCNHVLAWRAQGCR